MNTPSNETIAQVKFTQMMRLLKDSFLVCKSKPPSEAFPDAQRYTVVASFHKLRDAQEFHGMLVELWSAANDDCQ